MNFKWIALTCLVLQNSSLILLMRYTYLVPRTDDEHIYLASTAVFLAEVFKLLISIICCFYIDGNGNMKDFLIICEKSIFGNGWDWVHLTVPSTLYTIQNSLQYISTSQLSAPVFQVLSQLKIVTTALCSVLLLSRKISIVQWLAIIGLTCGVALVQISQQKVDLSSTITNNSSLGFITVLCGCTTSGFAGVYFEKILKSSNTGLWIRNIQLSAIGVITGLISCLSRNREEIMTHGFFVGYNRLVWTVIFLQVAGGLIVALVVKFADNVMKGFATSISILMSCFVSWKFLHDFQLTAPFLLGAMFVLVSLFVFTTVNTPHHFHITNSPSMNKKLSSTSLNHNSNSNSNNSNGSSTSSTHSGSNSQSNSSHNLKSKGQGFNSKSISNPGSNLSVNNIVLASR